MNTRFHLLKRGFTLLETVIAIGVLAVLLTGFIIVFAPAAAGVKKSINVQEADRLASTLEQELVTSRGSDPTPGFSKAFEWIRDSNTANTALLVYQYRGLVKDKNGNPVPPRSGDGTLVPAQDMEGLRPGENYVVQTMVRRRLDPRFTEDLAAVEGGVYLAKCTQLVFSGSELRPGTSGQIVDPKGVIPGSFTAITYPEAVIAFSAEFHALPAKSPNYFATRFAATFPTLRNPVFTRNLAVRR